MNFSTRSGGWARNQPFTDSEGQLRQTKQTSEQGTRRTLRNDQWGNLPWNVTILNRHSPYTEYMRQNRGARKIDKPTVGNSYPVNLVTEKEVDRMPHGWMEDLTTL